MQSILTNYVENCAICGTRNTEEHHLVFGSLRHLADADKLLLPLCRICHSELHRNTQANELSKICGQLAYEKSKVADGMTEVEARESFRARYGRSYL